jgi:hypothetical protein
LGRVHFGPSWSAPPGSDAGRARNARTLPIAPLASVQPTSPPTDARRGRPSGDERERATSGFTGRQPLAGSRDRPLAGRVRAQSARRARVHGRCRLLLLLRRASWRYTTSCDLTGCQPTPGYQAACGIGWRSRLAVAKGFTSDACDPMSGCLIAISRVPGYRPVGWRTRAG